MISIRWRIFWVLLLFEVMGQFVGNLAKARSYKTQASVVRAQGRAQQTFLNKRADFLEDEAVSDSHLAVLNMGRMRQNQGAAMGSARAARAASGLTAEGSGQQAEVATADVFERAIGDMALSNAISDSNKRYGAQMARFQGGLAVQQADEAASQYRDLSRNAMRAGLIQGIGSFGAGALGYSRGHEQTNPKTGLKTTLYGWQGAQAAYNSAYDLSGAGLSWTPGTLNGGSESNGGYLFDLLSSIFPKES